MADKPKFEMAGAGGPGEGDPELEAKKAQDMKRVWVFRPDVGFDSNDAMRKAWGEWVQLLPGEAPHKGDITASDARAKTPVMEHGEATHATVNRGPRPE
jgi:hypothetical protein